MECALPGRVLLREQEAPQCFARLLQKRSGTLSLAQVATVGLGCWGGRHTLVTVRCLANGVAVIRRQVALTAILQVLTCTTTEHPTSAREEAR